MATQLGRPKLRFDPPISKKYKALEFKGDYTLPTLAYLIINNESQEQVNFAFYCEDPRIVIRPAASTIQKMENCKITLALKPFGGPGSPLQRGTKPRITLTANLSHEGIHGQACTYEVPYYIEKEHIQKALEQLPKARTAMVLPPKLRFSGEFHNVAQQTKRSYSAGPYDGYSTAFVFIYNPSDFPIAVRISASLWFDWDKEGDLILVDAIIYPKQDLLKYIDFKGNIQDFQEFGGAFNPFTVNEYITISTLYVKEESNLRDIQTNTIPKDDFNNYFRKNAGTTKLKCSFSSNFSFDKQNSTKDANMKLIFNGPYDRERSSSITLSNPENTSIVYMIVSSEPKWYRYNKNYQVIPSRTTGQIEVTLRDLLNAFREKSSRKNEFRPLQMFGIYTCTIPEPNDDQAYLSHEMKKAKWRCEMGAFFVPCLFDEDCLKAAQQGKSYKGTVNPLSPIKESGFVKLIRLINPKLRGNKVNSKILQNYDQNTPGCTVSKEPPFNYDPNVPLPELVPVAVHASQNLDVSQQEYQQQCTQWTAEVNGQMQAQDQIAYLPQDGTANDYNPGFDHQQNFPPVDNNTNQQNQPMLPQDPATNQQFIVSPGTPTGQPQYDSHMVVNSHAVPLSPQNNMAPNGEFYENQGQPFNQPYNDNSQQADMFNYSPNDPYQAENINFHGGTGEFAVPQMAQANPNNGQSGYYTESVNNQGYTQQNGNFIATAPILNSNHNFAQEERSSPFGGLFSTHVPQQLGIPGGAQDSLHKRKSKSKSKSSVYVDPAMKSHSHSKQKNRGPNKEEGHTKPKTIASTASKSGLEEGNVDAAVLELFFQWIIITGTILVILSWLINLIG